MNKSAINTPGKLTYENKFINKIINNDVPFNIYKDGTPINFPNYYELAGDTKVFKTGQNYNNPIDVYTPPGIGDALWQLQYVISNTNRPINLKVYKRPGFASKFLLNIKNVISVEEFTSINGYEFKSFEEFRSLTRSKEEEYLKLKDLESIQEMYLEINYHMEKGIRIEDVFPNLKFSFNIPWEITQTDKNIANQIIDDKKIILLYSSSYTNNNMTEEIYKKINFCKWNSDSWVTLINNLLNNIDDQTRIIWVGATYDFDQSKYVMNKLNNSRKSEIIHLIDASTGVFIELLKRVKCVVSYQSGISSLALMHNVPTEMFWFKLLDNMHYSFCHPDLLSNKEKYKATRFDDYDETESINWVMNQLK